MIPIKSPKPDLRNINEQIYWYLRTQIITNQMKPGSRINYDDLTKELGISKTPLRDAFNRLYQEGLVEVRSRSGTFVREPSVQDVIEVFDIRQALERKSIALSINRIPRNLLEKMMDLTWDIESKFIESGNIQEFLEADFDFHQTIVKYSNNSQIIKILDTLNAQISWFGFLIVEKLKESAAQGMEHHRSILGAMLDMNSELAMNLMENHIEESKQTIIKDFSVRY
ncbi:GntR family transcriptional regulator [Neobacillus niacini]|uniref:GntR family transcriptional regulator n=1 Tax=Neobacillus niacini TaxID=86668 RepID=UPI0030006391